MFKYILLILLFPLHTFATGFFQASIANNISMASSFHSIGIDGNQLLNGSIQAVWTAGAQTGSLFIQVSNDIVPAAPVVSGGNQDPAANVVNWTTYTGSITAVAGAGNFMWNLSDMGYRWIRLAYTSSTGAGTLSAVFAGKTP